MILETDHLFLTGFRAFPTISSLILGGPGPALRPRGWHGRLGTTGREYRTRATRNAWLLDDRRADRGQLRQYGREVLQPLLDLLFVAANEKAGPRLGEFGDFVEIGIRLAEVREVAGSTKAIDIRMFAHLALIRIKLLGCRVMQRPRDGASEHRFPQARRVGLRGLHQAPPKREPKVDDLHSPAVLRLAHKQVGRLDVAMQNTRLVRGLERLGREDRHFAEVFERELAVLVDVLFKSEAAREMLDFEIGALLVRGVDEIAVDQFDDAGMVEGVEGSRFAEDFVDAPFQAGRLEGLDHDQAIPEVEIAAKQGDAERPRAEDLHHFVFAGIPDGEPRIGRRGEPEFGERFVLLLQFERGAVGGVVGLGLGERVGDSLRGFLRVDQRFLVITGDDLKPAQFEAKPRETLPLVVGQRPIAPLDLRDQGALAFVANREAVAGRQLLTKEFEFLIETTHLLMRVQHAIVDLVDPHLNPRQAIEHGFEALAMLLLNQREERKALVSAAVDRDQLDPLQLRGERGVFAHGLAEIILRGQREEGLPLRRGDGEEPAEVFVAEAEQFARNLLHRLAFGVEEGFGVVEPGERADFLGEGFGLEAAVGAEVSFVLGLAEFLEAEREIARVVLADRRRQKLLHLAAERFLVARGETVEEVTTAEGNFDGFPGFFVGCREC